MQRKEEAAGGVPVGAGVAFLLSQLGSHGAMRFGERLADLGLTPGHAGLLRVVAREPGLSQRQLADRLGAQPSRVVVLVDELESRGLLTRRSREGDRRSHVIGLTDAGSRSLATIRTIAEAHEAELTHTLSERERDQLKDLLGRLAAGLGLRPGVHPGYRRPSS
ncbi:MarR family winged helix-turn-helix transcriptional regulator [Blastococcus litoris]|uniref:MarR family winged helix-turn-helix transcriptional regulator n=1 Tax=Blastococcus litoris TaxID=2171622 RepID=UPI0019D1ED84|nr:MarR family winged helix-turn-helix transcriptional regulator [Blastococcus litoris]